MTSPPRQAFDEVLEEMREYAVHNRSAWDVLHDWADRLAATRPTPPGEPVAWRFEASSGWKDIETDPPANYSISIRKYDWKIEYAYLAPPVDVAEVERVALAVLDMADTLELQGETMITMERVQALVAPLRAALSAGGVR